MLWQNYWVRLYWKIKHSNLHFESRKAERKVADFWAMIFATYVIEHVMHLAMAKIRKDSTPGRENEAYSHRMLHSTWKIKSNAISAPEPWGSIKKPESMSSWCHIRWGWRFKLRCSNCGYWDRHWACTEITPWRTDHITWSHLWFPPKVPLQIKFHWAVLGCSKILLPKHPENFWYQWNGTKCHFLPGGHPTAADS